MTIDYIEGIEYHDGTMVSYPTPEGRIYFESGEAYYEYYLTDHLGNTRVVFSDRNDDGSISRFFEDFEIRAVKNYYPFGMEMDRPEDKIWPGLPPSERTRYFYNGIEYFHEMNLGWDFATYRILAPGLRRRYSADNW